MALRWKETKEHLVVPRKTEWKKEKKQGYGNDQKSD
jgi:hypothetical protein